MTWLQETLSICNWYSETIKSDPKLIVPTAELQCQLNCLTCQVSMVKINALLGKIVILPIETM